MVAARQRAEAKEKEAKQAEVDGRRFRTPITDAEEAKEVDDNQATNCARIVTITNKVTSSSATSSTNFRRSSALPKKNSGLRHRRRPQCLRPFLRTGGLRPPCARNHLASGRPRENNQGEQTQRH